MVKMEGEVQDNTESFLFKPEFTEEAVRRRRTLAISNGDSKVLTSDNDDENAQVGRLAVLLSNFVADVDDLTLN